MRTETKTIEIYNYGELSDKAKEKVKEDLHLSDFYGDFMLEERIATLRVLAEKINGTLDYSISLVPDRGEFITISGICVPPLLDLFKVKDECPLTGCCYDIDILEDAEKFGLIEALDKFLESIHKEYESMFEEDYIKEDCEANEREFTKDGSIY